jgi:aryl-alcohol dehydrogenase-like predicted oxidoreductase
MAALGRPGYINLGHAADLAGEYDRGAMEAHAHGVLDAAFAAGVRYFDAARSYGDGERFLASWLQARSIDPQAVFVASKWGYTYTAGWKVEAEKHEVKDHSLAVLRRQAEESRALLGPYLSLYQIHSATLESGVLENWEVLGELGRLRERGWGIGLSVTGPQQASTVRKAMGVRIDGAPLFAAVQATWNLLERSAGAALAEAHAAGLRVIVKEALANGRLTPRDSEADFAVQRGALEMTAARLGASVDALALAAVLAQSWVDVVLSGAATVEQVRSNAEALTVAWDAAAEEELAGLAEDAEAYWGRRARLAWN